VGRVARFTSRSQGFTECGRSRLANLRQGDRADEGSRPVRFFFLPSQAQPGLGPVGSRPLTSSVSRRSGSPVSPGSYGSNRAGFVEQGGLGPSATRSPSKIRVLWSGEEGGDAARSLCRRRSKGSSFTARGGRNPPVFRVVFEEDLESGRPPVSKSRGEVPDLFLGYSRILEPGFSGSDPKVIYCFGSRRLAVGRSRASGGRWVADAVTSLLLRGQVLARAVRRGDAPLPAPLSTLRFEPRRRSRVVDMRVDGSFTFRGQRTRRTGRQTQQSPPTSTFGFGSGPATP